MVAREPPFAPPSRRPLQGKCHDQSRRRSDFLLCQRVLCRSCSRGHDFACLTKGANSRLHSPEFDFIATVGMFGLIAHRAPAVKCEFVPGSSLVPRPLPIGAAACLRCHVERDAMNDVVVVAGRILNELGSLALTDLVAGAGAVVGVVGNWCGTISGNLKLSDQAARSIG